MKINKRSTKRKAPSNGYLFTNKEIYRRQIWNKFMAVVRPGYAHSMNCLFLPSSEGREIQVAEQKGFRLQRMHVVDSNPAIVSHLTRRYPGIHTYGVKLGVAAGRIKKQSGSCIQLANLDLCNRFGHSMVMELGDVALSDCFAPTAAIGINMLRGRETGDYWDALDRVADTIGQDWVLKGHNGIKLIPTDLARMALCMLPFYCSYVCVFMGSGIYKSCAGNQTMLWFCFAISKRSPENTGIESPGAEMTSRFISDAMRAFCVPGQSNSVEFTFGKQIKLAPAELSGARV